MKKRYSNRFLRRLFISLFVVLTIPCFILCILYKSDVSNVVINEVNNIIKSEQLSAVKLLDAEIQQLDESVQFFQRCEGYQSYLSHYRLQTDKDGVINSLQILSDISYIYRIQSQMDCFFVWLTSADTILSVNGMYRPAVFFSTNFIDESLPADDMGQYYLALEKPCVIRSEALRLKASKGEYLSFFYPLTDSAGTVGLAAFSVQVEQLAEYFTAHTKNLGTCCIVADGNGNYLFSTNASDTILSHCLSDSTFFDSSGQEDPLKLDGITYLPIKTVSTYTDWKIVTLVPQTTDLQTMLFDSSRFFLIYVILCVTFGGLIIIVLLQLNYAPIKDLREKAIATIADSKDKKTDHDVLVEIAHVLDYLQSENATLRNSHMDKVQAIQMARLQRLLNDFYSSLDEFNTDCEQIGLSFQFNFFFISDFLFADQIDSEETPQGAQRIPAALAEEISSVLSETFESKYVFSLKRDQIVFIHSVSGPGPIDLMPFKRALDMISERYCMTASVGISHIHEGTTTMSKSLLQAIRALDYRFSRGTGCVISYDQTNGHLGGDCPYPNSDLNRLQNAINANDFEQCQMLIDRMIQYIASSNMPTFVARCVCFDIVKLFLMASDKYLINTYPLTQTLMTLSETESVETFSDMIRDLSASLSNSRQPNKSNEDGQLLQDVLSYIDENYCRGDFSIQEVASHFNLPPSGLSSFFKANMQCGLLEYLIRLRMDKAKELLHTTDLSLKEVSLSVGYYNVSSFIRRFKAQEGVTPNAYRFKC